VTFLISVKIWEIKWLSLYEYEEKFRTIELPLVKKNCIKHNNVMNDSSVNNIYIVINSDFTETAIFRI
jgi:hypothetical protein